MTTSDGPHSEYGPGVRPTDPLMLDILDSFEASMKAAWKANRQAKAEARRIDRLCESLKGARA